MKEVENCKNFLFETKMRWAKCLKKNAGMNEGFRILDKLFMKKLNLYKKELHEKCKKIVIFKKLRKN